MEAVNEAHVAAPQCYDKLQDVSATAKGKRTKRQRLPLSLITAATNTNNRNDRLSPSSSSAATSSEESTTTEEEDTARCLILLARGGRFQTHPLITKADNDDEDDDDDDDYHSKQKNSGRKRPRAAGEGACMYACKTCGRVFPSFQALGGHRASHKKPKTEKIKTATFLISDEERLPPPPTALSLQSSNICTEAKTLFASPRLHECSYCGAEFASGQALGGHMRRHRPMSLSSKIAAAVEEPGSQSGPGSEPEELRIRSIGLSLDLNLPAPEKLVILSTARATLVDCHYY